LLLLIRQREEREEKKGATGQAGRRGLRPGLVAKFLAKWAL
jgi:hypothetical protein